MVVAAALPAAIDQAPVEEAVVVNHAQVPDADTRHEYGRMLVHVAAFLAGRGKTFHTADRSDVLLFDAHLEQAGSTDPAAVELLAVRRAVAATATAGPEAAIATPRAASDLAHGRDPVPDRALTDSAYLSAVLRQIDGPVIAVGRSYGGAVITNAATDTARVEGLVYAAAFAPDEGEVLGAVEAASKDSVPHVCAESGAQLCPNGSCARQQGWSCRARG